MNVDGSRTQQGIIGAGGVIRNHSGDWIKGFIHHIGIGEVLQAEAWDIFIGLKLASDLCIRNLEVECDSALAVSLMSSENLEFYPFASLVHNCRTLMRSFAFCSLNHVHRERNFAADLLAKDSVTSSRGTVFLRHPPAHLVQTLLDDMIGVGHARLLGSYSYA